MGITSAQLDELFRRAALIMWRSWTGNIFMAYSRHELDR